MNKQTIAAVFIDNNFAFCVKEQSDFLSVLIDAVKDYLGVTSELFLDEVDEPPCAKTGAEYFRLARYKDEEKEVIWALTDLY